ncbi:nSTAND1 domain-containing NTPase [Sorangium sp. So ce131]|uniref:nSTAND1 domain-containing NTPase n=1 Tax=Sorangium sp. So ce131 TaxID=3133282 RepID=UPI003F601907
MSPLVTNPFPGPRPYRASDRGRFYGREEISYRLQGRLLASRCVTVYGPSGAGKSSLMQASVIPALVDAQDISVARVDAWPEDEEPTRWLVQAVYVDLDLGEPPEGVSAEDALLAAARRAARRSSRITLLYLDQIEQLLYASRSVEACEAFFDSLNRLVELPLRNLRVALSLREDYLGRLRDRLRDHRRLLDHGFRVGPLSVGELSAAVCRAAAAGEPPQAWGLEELLALMLQVRVPGQAATEEAEAQSAYAQVVCRALFQRRAQGGGAAGEVEAEPILRGYLEATLDALGPLRGSAQRLLEDHLVTADGSRTLRTERELLRVIPEEELSPILEALEGAAILHAEEHQGSRYFEIGHDWLARRVSEQRQQREREEEQRRREEEQRRELLRQREASEARLAKERAQRRRLVLIAAASVALAAGAAGVGLWAMQKESVAVEARDEAERQAERARRLGNEALEAQREAEEQKRVAEEQKGVADEQRRIAEEQTRVAEAEATSALMAEAVARDAEEQARLAETQARVAETQARQAAQQAQAAERQARDARDQARQAADEERRAKERLEKYIEQTIGPLPPDLDSKGEGG